MFTHSQPDVRVAEKRSHSRGWSFTLYSVLLLVALALGWRYRDQLQFEADYGAGYWLGVAGISCVGLLLIYPVRKRIPKLAFIGSVPVWFHLHMALGLLAPVLILFHSRFETGSVNARVALIAMLIVAGSGIVGRVLYVRIHRGLTGQKNEARIMAAEAALLSKTLIEDFSEVAEIAGELEQGLHARQSGVVGAFSYAIGASNRISIARGKMLAAVRRGSKILASEGGFRGRAAGELRRQSRRLVRTYCRTLKRAAYLTVFERLFSLWHVMHLPLFVLMIIAAVIHVVAVHLY